MKGLQWEDTTVDFYTEELDMDLGAAYMTLRPVRIADLMRTYATKTIKPISSHLLMAQNQALKDGHLNLDLGAKILSHKKYVSIYYLTWINAGDAFIDVGSFRSLYTFESFIRAVVAYYHRHRQKE